MIILFILTSVEGSLFLRSGLGRRGSGDATALGLGEGCTCTRLRFFKSPRGCSCTGAGDDN